MRPQALIFDGPPGTLLAAAAVVFRTPEIATIKHASATERRRLAGLALGRIFRLMSRPTEPGDVEEYEHCRAIFLEAIDGDGGELPDHSPNYARDHGRGAAGQW